MALPERQVEFPLCTSCNRPITPGERAVKLPCPYCGEVLIWRCEKCRKFFRTYRCVNCGFKGP